MSRESAYQPDYAVSPGDVLDEHREAAAMTPIELAQRLHFTTGYVSRRLTGLEPVTPEVALKLEAVFGLPARLWLDLEARYREHLSHEPYESSAAEVRADCQPGMRTLSLRATICCCMWARMRMPRYT
ncbi:MAG: helix-turn-helix domain-containing protein [Rhodocyclaceae bacterium]|nr:helix-turn-helix domain-containing protein [Rhodocyclaceae bacterium]